MPEQYLVNDQASNDCPEGRDEVLPAVVGRDTVEAQ